MRSRLLCLGNEDGAEMLSMSGGKRKSFGRAWRLQGCCGCTRWPHDVPLAPYDVQVL